MKSKTSRNQREGVYIGAVQGAHRRLFLGSPLRHLSSDADESCDECETWSKQLYTTSTGLSDHPEYGQYRWWEGESICRNCGHKEAFDDSSI